MRTTVHLQERARDVDRWCKGDVPASLVKSNNGRDVWRVGVGSPALYVKRFPRELLRNRATKEADLLKALEQARIPCPRLVATASDKTGSYILTEEIPDAVPLADLFQQHHPRARDLVRKLGQLTRRLHDAGFDHQDFHTGNVLVRDADLYVIDVHRAARKSSLSEEKRMDGVAFTAMSFVEARPLSDVLRFFRAYGLADRARIVDAWTRLRRRRHEYYLGRQKRAFKDGSGFGIRGELHYRKGVDLDPILARVNGGSREAIRQTKAESLHRVDGTLFVKTTSPARAKKIWENAHGLQIRGIDTPAVFAWNRTWVAGEWVPSSDLHEYIQAGYKDLDARGRREFLFRLARVVRRLHDYGVYHGDLKAGNVLVGGGRILIVDLDRVKFRADLADRERRFNLAQLNASVAPPLTKTDRLRFLDFYIGTCAAQRKQRREWIVDVMKTTRARRHRWPLH